MKAKFIEHIEKALGFKLQDWQKDYILTGEAVFPRGRRNGRTTAYCTRMALDPSKTYTFPELLNYADGDHGFAYPYWFRDKFLEIRDRLRDQGFEVCEVVKKRQRKPADGSRSGKGESNDDIPDH
jgi:hypothetical protein